MPCQLETKSNVNWDVCSAIEEAQFTIAKVYLENKGKAVVTSARDGRHSKQTAHDDGNAIDLRITNLFRDLQGSRRTWYGFLFTFAKHLSAALDKLPSPGRFDLVLEKDHIHLEHSAGRTPNIKGWDPATSVYCSAEVREFLNPGATC